MGVDSVTTLEECAEACCNQYGTCDTYQFCNTTECVDKYDSLCWVGIYAEDHTYDVPGWLGKSHQAPPPAPSTNKLCNEAWCQINTDDASWRTVDVPHDFVVEGNFTDAADIKHGFLFFGVGFYRKKILLPSETSYNSSTHSIYLEFDGAQTESTVYLAEHLLGSHGSGYTPFSFLLNDTQAQQLFSLNHLLLSVKVDSTNPDSWW